MRPPARSAGHFRIAWFAVWFPIAIAAPSWAGQVVSVWPVANANAAGSSDTLRIQFDQPLDSSSLPGADLDVFGRWSGPAAGIWSLDSGGSVLRFLPLSGFFKGEMVSVALSHRLRFAEGDTLSEGFAWQFWVAPDTGLLDLVALDTVSLRRPGEGHVQSYGAYAGDLDHDGFSDLSIPNEITVDVRVCLNDGAGGYGAFTVFPIPGGSTPSPNEGADFNGDGNIDLAVGHGGNDQLSVLMGDGQGGYLPAVNYTSGPAVRGVTVLDLDLDGDADIVTANRVGNNLTLFYNDGTGGFDSSRALEAGISSETAVATADANGDGIMDVFVGGYNGQELSLLLGDGHGNLTFSSKIAAGGRCWMLATGDIDGDGDVDVASANSFSNNTAVAFGNGAGGFDSVRTYAGGQFTLAVDLGDVDGDGDLDMVTSHYSSAGFILWENDGHGVFGHARNYPSGSAGSCVLLHDRDNDGDLDISGIDEVDDLLFLFDNRCPQPIVGDLNLDLVLTSGDVVSLVNFVFKAGAAPQPCIEVGDVNCSGQVTSGDIIGLVNHVFKGGPPPCTLCACPIAPN